LTAALAAAPVAANAEAGDPKFEAFPALERYAGQPRMLNFGGRADIRQAFRERADIAVDRPFAQRPDFAGAYRLVNFDCRPVLHCTYLVHLNSGRVVPLAFNVHREFLRYRETSRLLIVEADGAHVKRRSIWVLERGGFRQIR
jgi:hypothetical protein